MDSGQFREWFQSQLARREWTQRDFSRRSGISPSTVSEWHRGTRVPDPASIDRIADVFGLPVDDVLTLAGHRPATELIRPDDPRAELIGLVKRVRRHCCARLDPANLERMFVSCQSLPDCHL